MKMCYFSFPSSLTFYCCYLSFSNGIHNNSDNKRQGVQVSNPKREGASFSVFKTPLVRLREAIAWCFIGSKWVSGAEREREREREREKHTQKTERNDVHEKMMIYFADWLRCPFFSFWHPFQFFVRGDEDGDGEQEGSLFDSRVTGEEKRRRDTSRNEKTCVGGEPYSTHTHVLSLVLPWNERQEEKEDLNSRIIF